MRSSRPVTPKALPDERQGGSPPLAVVAMSGGVDSSLAAALMAEAGWRTVGVTLKLLPRGETGFGCCGSPVDIDDAKRVCERLAIPHYVLELSELFADKVIRPFLDAYMSARTPNPCVECNRSVKFGYLLALAEAWGAARLATGHYARVERGSLLKARDSAKDQSYFLYSLTERELERVCFPVGELSKYEVRDKARALGLKTADKPESQEICFVPGRDYRAYLKAEADSQALGAAFAPGPIRDAEDRVLGTHEGLAAYTVGQRRGLGLSGEGPWYVVGLERESNTLRVGSREQARRRGFRVGALSWSGGRPSGPRRAQVRVRHRHQPAACSIEPEGEAVRVACEQPQWAVTPGQAAVFYDGDAVLGGGTIASVEAL